LTPEGKKLMETFEKLHSLCDPYFKEMAEYISSDTM